MLRFSDIFAQPYRPYRVEEIVGHSVETVTDQTTGRDRRQCVMFLPSDVGGDDALASLARAGVEPVAGETKENGMLAKYKVPSGWYVQGRGYHYSKLFDSAGHVRALLQLDHFFRRTTKARMPLIGRFYLYTQFNQKDEGFHVQVRDRDNSGAVLFAGKPWDFSCEEKYGEGLRSRRAEAEAWLDATYPKWRDPSAHR